MRRAERTARPAATLPLARLVRLARPLVAGALVAGAGCRMAPPLTPLPREIPATGGVDPSAASAAADPAAPVSAPRPMSTPVASPVSPAASDAAQRRASAPADAAATDEVVRAAVAVFGDSAVTAGSDSAGSMEPMWDLDVRSYETHDRVAHYVELFTGTARDRFAQRLSRGTRYEPMIRAKLRASGMPEDLTYLALIESGYDPHAYSRAAAVGMWQFMSSTARDVGLRVDWWMDERRDPARATDGAIRFLGILQRQFGSFYLAAAAYNGGPGRVSRGLTRFADELEGFAGEDRFFALAEQDYLRAETKNYVPQLIAAALVAKVPSRYGIALDSLPPYAYDSVEVAPGTSLQAMAREAALDATVLKELNPAVLRGVTPPDARVWVRVPAGQGPAVQLALNTVSADALRGWELVTLTGSTTTPSALAARHDVTVKQLRWYNPTWRTTKKGRLVSGQSVRIPRTSALALARELPDPSIERYGPAGASGLGTRGLHVVRRGETLGGIARRYGLTESRLRTLNGMRGTRILAGQTLVVRAGSVAKRATSKASTAKKPTAKKSTAKKSTAKRSTAKKSTAKKSTAKKPTAKKSTAKKPTAKKSTATKKPVAKKPVATKKR